MLTCSVLYDEGHPDTYQGFKLRLLNKSEVIFNHGNPSLDQEVMTQYIITKYGQQMLEFVYASSSVDNFVLDGGTLDKVDPNSLELRQALIEHFPELSSHE